MWTTQAVPIWRWPNLLNAYLMDTIVYCYNCNYQYNVSTEGHGTSLCPSCRVGLRIWVVEEGEKEEYERWFNSN